MERGRSVCPGQPDPSCAPDRLRPSAPDPGRRLRRQPGRPERLILGTMPSSWRVLTIDHHDPVTPFDGVVRLIDLVGISTARRFTVNSTGDGMKAVTGAEGWGFKPSVPGTLAPTYPILVGPTKSLQTARWLARTEYQLRGFRPPNP